MTANKRVMLWAALAAVTVGTGALVMLGRGGSGTPRALPVAPGGNRANGEDAAAGATTLLPGGAAMPWADVSYVAAGELPRLGGEARAYRLTAPDREMIERLAAGLGLSGSFDAAEDGGFVVTDGTNTLYVFGTSWSMGPRDGSGSSGSSGGSVGSGVVDPCEVAPDGTTKCDEPSTTIPQRPTGLPTQADAEQRALDVLAAGGYDTSGAAVESYDGITSWWTTVTFEIDGQPAYGYSASVTVGVDGAIEYASGVLGTLESIGDYPLLDTHAAIDRLNEFGPWYGGGPAILSPGIATDSRGDTPVTGGATEPAPPPTPETTLVPPETTVVPPDSIPAPEPVTITLQEAEIVLGLTWSWDGTSTYLLPTYVFRGTDSGGNDVEVSALAIDGDFLETPPADGVRPGAEN